LPHHHGIGAPTLKICGGTQELSAAEQRGRRTALACSGAVKQERYTGMPLPQFSAGGRRAPLFLNTLFGFLPTMVA